MEPSFEVLRLPILLTGVVAPRSQQLWSILKRFVFLTVLPLRRRERRPFLEAMEDTLASPICPATTPSGGEPVVRDVPFVVSMHSSPCATRAFEPVYSEAMPLSEGRLPPNHGPSQPGGLEGSAGVAAVDAACDCGRGFLSLHSRCGHGRAGLYQRRSQWGRSLHRRRLSLDPWCHRQLLYLHHALAQGSEARQDAAL